VTTQKCFRQTQKFMQSIQDTDQLPILQSIMNESTMWGKNYTKRFPLELQCKLTLKEFILTHTFYLLNEFILLRDD